MNWWRKLKYKLDLLAYRLDLYLIGLYNYVLLQWRKNKVLAGPVMGIVLLLTLLNVGTFMVADKAYRTYSATQEGSLKTNATLDDAAVYFDAKTRDIINAKECFPIHMNQPKGINVLYLYCSPEAYAQDGREVQVTETFKVSPRIARRYNFWRRIYSLWGEDQYVMHLAEYPEVILEIGDASPLGPDVSWLVKKKKVKSVLNSHRWQFKQLLWKMHKDRNKPETFSPAMRRIASKMAHIQDQNKYMRAASNVRIQRGQRDQIASGLTQATRYMDAVANAFVEEGLPRELSQLAFIESSFNLKAYSKVGAAGVYQIMPSTGREYMMVTDAIDERRDPIKSAHAAAKLLKMNHKILGEWPLAVTAYNHGAGGIRRAVRTVGSNNIEDLIEKYDGPAFGFASKNFFSGFLAVMATISESDRLFPEVTRLAPLRYEDVKLYKAMRIKTLRDQYKITNEIIYMYNPDISRSLVRANGLLPKGYVFKVPSFEKRLSGLSRSGKTKSPAVLTGADE